jgi:hypothetical protein
MCWLASLIEGKLFLLKLTLPMLMFWGIGHQPTFKFLSTKRPNPIHFFRAHDWNQFKLCTWFIIKIIRLLTSTYIKKRVAARNIG